MFTTPFTGSGCRCYSWGGGGSDLKEKRRVGTNMSVEDDPSNLEGKKREPSKTPKGKADTSSAKE